MISKYKSTGQWIVMSFLGLGTPAVLAASQSAINSLLFSAYPTVVTLSAGAVWEHAGEAQTFDLTPGVSKTYTANHSTNTLADIELFLGKQMPLPRNLQGQLGLAFAATSNAKLSGDIWDDADPAFDNYTYRYQIRHTHLALKGKLLYDGGYFVTPWISGSAGVGFNTAHNFSNTPTISEAIAMPNFASNTITAFTYTLGVGIQRDLNQQWQVGIGYEFADWGKSQLSRASGQTLNNGLSLSHLYTSEFLLNLTYSA